MVAQSDDFDLHERIERQRTQDFVEFGWAFHVKDTNIRVFAGDSPQMEPFALQLQFCCPLVLQRAELRDPVCVDVVGNAHNHGYME